MIGGYHVRFCEKLGVRFLFLTRQRFWRTIKYQYIYLNPENNDLKLYKGIKKWIERYYNRAHQESNRMKPNIIYYNAA